MDGKRFAALVETISGALLAKAGLALTDLRVGGRAHVAEFGNGQIGVTIGFEPGDNFLSFDVHQVSPEGNRVGSGLTLAELNRLFAADIPAAERDAAAALVAQWQPRDALERRLAKSVVDLSLVLPRYTVAAIGSETSQA